MKNFYGLFSKKLRIMVLVANLIFVPVASLNAASLDEVTSTEVTTEAVVTEGDGAVESGTVMDGMNTDADMSQEEEGISEFRTAMQKGTALVVQGIAVVATFGLTVILGADLLYILLPPFRGLLANGQVGVAKVDPNAQAQQNQGGMGMGGMSGGYGMGGMSGGYGGMSGGYGGMSGMGGMNGQQGQQPASTFCIVSDEALNAVATAKQEPTGKIALALRIWVKHAVIYLIATPVIVTLLLTGVLQQLGFGIGGLLDKAIHNFSANM